MNQLIKASKRVLIVLALAVILVLSVSGGVMAAGPHNGDCPNDGVCQNDGESPSDGHGMQTRTQASMAFSYQNQYIKQFNANGHCYANQHCNTYQYSYGLISK